MYKHEGLRAALFDEDLYSHRSRHMIITRILGIYIKKYLENYLEILTTDMALE